MQKPASLFDNLYKRHTLPRLFTQFMANSINIQKLFVTLEEIAEILYIKAVWEIEDFEGYG